MKFYITSLLLLVQISALSQHNHSISELHNVYTFGNLVDLNDSSSFFSAFEKELKNETGAFTVIVNGDIIDYKNFPESKEEQKGKFKSLIGLIGRFEKGNLIFIPGDRDWYNGQQYGYECVRSLEKEFKKFAKERNIENFKWIAKKACPGPFKYSIDSHVELIAVNSQWWNHNYDKPRPSDATCKHITITDIKEELEDIIDDNRNKNVLIVAHHPIKSLGNYGGHFSFRDHLRPFPLAGSIEKAYRANVGGEKDLSNEDLRKYSEFMEYSIFLHHNLIYASSHEKNQQVLKMGDNFFLNSGAQENPSYAGHDFTTKYSASKNGVMKISYFKSGGVKLNFLEYNNVEPSFSKEFSQTLFNSACSIEEDEGDTNLSYIPCAMREMEARIEEDINFSKGLSIAAGAQYKAGPITRFFMGKHYRKDWYTPIETQYLDIDTTFNGLNAVERGGGRQTMSLKFKNEHGDIYTFRSVDKDPSKALDYKLRTSILKRIFRDQTSAQQPYGAMTIATLIEPLNILHAKPKLYVLPDVNALGYFRNQYGGLLGMLEEHPGKKNIDGQYFANADDVLKSNKLFRSLYKSRLNKVNEKEFLRARLFDIYVGDWSKHEDNWKWAAFKNETQTIYRPIPRDRDMVFSKWDGLIPSIADLPFGIPSTEGFDKKIKGFRSSVYQARHMDRFLLNELPKEEFLKQAEIIQEAMTPAHIENSLKELPKASYDLSSKEISTKLNARRKDLKKYALKYYHWLNKEVEIVGSKKKDFFKIECEPNDNVNIKLFAKADEELVKVYDRTFNPSETKMIRIYGLAAKDSFEFANNYISSIDLKLFGGNGEDKYPSVNKLGKTKIYDLDNLVFEKGVKQEKQFVHHWNKEIYEYDRSNLKFNSWLPSLSVGYNQYRGFTLSLGNTWKNQRWDKEDFASKHTIKANLATQSTYGFTYSGVWKECFRKWNITADLIFANPQYFDAYFGEGNNTIIDPQVDFDTYYVARYNQYEGRVGVQRKFWERSYVNIKTGFGRYTSKPDSMTILFDRQDSILGAVNSLDAIPTSMELVLDLLDHRNFPTNGIRFKMAINNYTAINDDLNNYGVFNSSMDTYLSNNAKRKLTLGVKISGALAFGNVPYFHQPRIGGSTGLRGYIGNRFSGESIFYTNTDLRYEIANLRKAAIPVRIGINAFFDTGKVFQFDKAESTSPFKRGYGGGVYIIPFSRSFTFSINFGWSDEESFLPMFSFGTFLN